MPAVRRSSRGKTSSGPVSSTPAVRSRAPRKAAGSTGNRKKAAKPAQTAATSDLPSTSSLLKNSRQTTDEWLKSARTKKGYGNYVKGGKKWLVEWTAEGRLDDEISEDAFDNEVLPPQKASRSAFKDYFEQVCGCQGDFWKYNSHIQKWEGNPVFESGFKTYYESLKNRHNRTSTATQALPMLPADLKVIMDYLDSPEAIKYFTVTQSLYFKAFVTTAFTLWTRNDELVSLQFKDIKLNLHSKTGIPYHEFSLIFRKTNKDPTKVQKYMVQIDLAHPEIDYYTHVEAWKAHMERLLGRPLARRDYVFPALASTGQIKFGEPTSRSAFETLLDEVVDKSNVLQGRNGKFTTHCFRRGGAQYRFLWADRKWSLKAVKWWGGWSSNENVGTLMRYLLDELMAYEEGFSDIMMDDRVIDRHETFMGEDEMVPVSKADLSKFEESILAKIQGLIASATTSSGSTSMNTPVRLPEDRVHTPTSSVEHPPATPSPPSLRPDDPTPPSQYIPRPSRIPETKTLDDALAYWEHGAPQKGLDVPLKDWAALFKSSEYTSEAVKLGNIQFVCDEFRVHCNGDFTTFEERFPGLRRKFTALMKAVRAARKLRGETKCRSSHK
ncbi:hypothetical protein MVEN_01154200 [Mycena venus]|uniref:Tyr recombinase domain-containing protein n=1 Tax=Mycena venus TaxID=2733690 RepID=A0A8H7CVE1_9AGAR|nr:hypothetical protein MVEN_01154200 [Mycena venus]